MIDSASTLASTGVDLTGLWLAVGALLGGLMLMGLRRIAMRR